MLRPARVRSIYADRHAWTLQCTLCGPLGVSRADTVRVDIREHLARHGIVEARLVNRTL